MEKKEGSETRHALTAMRNPATALSILAREDFEPEKVALCVCCQNSGTSACPYLGNEVKGPCPHYRLDETDVVSTERRIIDRLRE